MLSIAPLLLAATLFAPAAPFEPLAESAVLEAPTRHIRTTDASMRKLMRRGFRDSRTFKDLVTRLQRSDVIVYIEEVPRLPGALEGRMMMLPRAHDHRYLRIQITLRGSIDDGVALLGHELHHAVEVAEAVNVHDNEGLTRLYQRIGVRRSANLYDTTGAQDAGRRIREELSL